MFRRWTEDRCPQIAASLTYTTLLALVPVFAIAVATLSSMPFFEAVMVRLKIFLLLNLVPELAGKIIIDYMEPFARNAAKNDPGDAVPAIAATGSAEAARGCVRVARQTGRPPAIRSILAPSSAMNASAADAASSGSRSRPDGSVTG